MSGNSTNKSKFEDLQLFYLEYYAFQFSIYEYTNQNNIRS